MTDSCVVLGEFHRERNSFLLAHRLENRTNGMEHLADRKGRWLTLHESFATRRSNQIGDSGAQAKRGAVNKSELTLADWIGGPFFGVTQRVDEEKNRAERRSDIVCNC